MTGYEQDGTVDAVPEREGICSTLLERAEELDTLAWWLVEFVCRQGLSMATAAGKLDMSVEEAASVWSSLEDAIRSGGSF